GPDAPGTCRTRAILATSYKYDQKYDRAAPLFESAVAGLERSQGPDDPDVLSIKVAISGAYLELHRYKETQAVLEPEIERIRRVFGDRNYQTMVALYNLACVHANLNDPELAISYLRRSMELGWAYPTTGPIRDPQLMPLHGNPRFEELARQG